MRYILFAHGGSGNHGCEALVRSTVKIIKEKNPNAEIIVASHAIQEDKKYGIDFVEYVEYLHFKSYNPIRYIDKFAREVLKSGVFRKRLIAPVTKILQPDDICLSIGGDNYSYKNVIPYDVIGVHNAAIKMRCKTILWGCSIDKKNMQGTILKDLLRYDYIVCRESITYNNLLEVGVNKDRILLCADPAFLLEKEDRILPKKCIGINASPVVVASESEKNIVQKNYVNLIEYILKYTNDDILLIPHVVWSNSDDRLILTKLYQRFRNDSRVHLVNDDNAKRLKGIISKCEVFVGARTHSTIAAYSTCVPTLVLGYSVKARGIARDIFGTSEHYTISVQSLTDDMQLKEAFIWIYNNRNKIRHHLENIIPEYCKKAINAGKVL